jgi:hypothetical protein
MLEARAARLISFRPAAAGNARQRPGRVHARREDTGDNARGGAFKLCQAPLGDRLPGPFGVEMVVHDPLATSLKALP